MTPPKPFACSVLLGLVAAAGSGREPLAKGTLQLQAALSELPQGRTHPVWVSFRDKGAAGADRASEARRRLTPRALSRRSLRSAGRAVIQFEDLRLEGGYVDEVARRVTRLRHQSRWFNAVSVDATPEQVEALAGLSFVTRLDLVRHQRRPPDPVPARAASTLGAPPAALVRAHALDYGTSFNQVSQVNVPAVHDLGLHGEGVVIAMLDSGFDNLAHEAFSSLSILATQDFVNGDEDVGDGIDVGEGSHGTSTLSVVGGYAPGQLIGPAFAAYYLLAKTENTDSETPLEEDNWAVAAEWAEALGADVISSSLGYLGFDAPHASYTFAEMNGETAICTLAADLAARRGVVVVNSAGNSGFHPQHNTLGAPADGKLVLAVGAVDARGARVIFSSIGPSSDGRIKPDLAAQGSGVKAARPGGTNAYAAVGGTSFSCPLTAGVAALVLQAHPAYTVEQVRAVLRSTASQAAAPDTLLGWGIVNALAAFQAPEPLNTLPAASRR